MARTSSQIKLEEISGDQFPDLPTAQRSARAAFAMSLAQTMRGLLADGLLINVNGTIIPNPERTSKA